MLKSVRLLTLPLIAIVVAGVVLLAALYIGDRRREARESTCRGRLSQMALAFRAYHSDYGVFPPNSIRDQTGRPIHSWRVLLLPYMDLKGIYSRYEFTEPWNGPHNAALSQSVPQYVRDLFKCPNDRNSTFEWTSFLAIDGSLDSETSDRPVISTRQADNPCSIMLVEVHHSEIHWMEPRDLPRQQALKGVILLSPNASNVNFLTADLQVGTLSADSVVFRNSEADLLKRWLIHH